VVNLRDWFFGLRLSDDRFDFGGGMKTLFLLLALFISAQAKAVTTVTATPSFILGQLDPQAALVKSSILFKATAYQGVGKTDYQIAMLLKAWLKKNPISKLTRSDVFAIDSTHWSFFLQFSDLGIIPITITSDELVGK